MNRMCGSGMYSCAFEEAPVVESCEHKDPLPDIMRDENR
jgi:hypothetical protein